VQLDVVVLRLQEPGVGKRCLQMVGNFLQQPTFLAAKKSGRVQHVHVVRVVVHHLHTLDDDAGAGGPRKHLLDVLSTFTEQSFGLLDVVLELHSVTAMPRCKLGPRWIWAAGFGCHVRAE